MSQQSKDHAQGKYVEYGNDPGSLRYGGDIEGGSESLAETLVIGNVTGGTDIEVSAGDKIISPAGANIELAPGAGGGVVLDANTTVNGKLTVTGLIDPTGLIFEEAAAPSTAADEGALFVSDGSGGLVQNDLYYRRSSDGAILNLTAALSAVNYKGTWDADTNTPVLGNGGAGGDQGDYYVVSVAGNTSIDGISDWEVGDWIINNGTIWQKVDNTDQVTSVNGQQGAVSIGLPEALAEDNTTGGNNIEISAGDKIVSPLNEDIELEPAGSGEVILDADTTVNGKLTVTGLIDPTGLILNEAAAPSTAAAEGAFFVSDGSGGLIQNDPYYRPGSDGVPINLLQAGVGAGLYGETYVLWVAPNQTGAVDDNDLDTPFVTIQGSIDALSNAGIWASGAAGGFIRAQVLVASGRYDEDLRIPQAPGTGDVFLVMTAIGAVTLGDGILQEFGSTVPRSITWWNDQTAEDAGSHDVGGNDRRPTLVLNAIGGSSGEGTGGAGGGHSAYSGGWMISGSIYLAGGALPNTAVDLHLEHVKVSDAIVQDPVDPHTGALHCYFYRCQVGAEFNHPNAYLEIIDSCRFVSTLTAFLYGRLSQCRFEGAIEMNGPDPSPLLPQGFFECAFSGVPTVEMTGLTAFVYADCATNVNLEKDSVTLLGKTVVALLDGHLERAVALVNPNADSAIDNASLATPFITVQAAVDAVIAAEGGEVLVSPGYYDETVIVDDSNPNALISLKGLSADGGDVSIGPTSSNMPGLVISNATRATLLPWLANPANYELDYGTLLPNGNSVTAVKVEDIQFVGQGLSQGWGVVIAGVDGQQMGANFSRVAAINSGGQSRGCWCYEGDTYWYMCAVLGGMLMLQDSDPVYRHCNVDWLEAWDDCHPVADFTRFGNNPGVQDAINYNANAGTAVKRFRSCHFAGDIDLNGVSRIDIWGGTIETNIDCADNCVFDMNNVHTGGNITIGAVGGPLSCPYFGGQYMGVLADPGGRINRVIGA